MLANWQNSTDCSYSISDEVHVWKIPLDLPQEIVLRLKNVLSKDETERANRFHFSKDHNRYIVTRGTLRILLAKYLKKNAEEIDFIYNEYGKPFLKDFEFQFNVSHSNALGLIAFDSLFPLGVDIEWKRPDFASAKIGKRFFSTAEVEELLKLAEEEIHDGFFNCWTRKEAYIKALGKGLNIPLSKFQVSLAPEKTAQLLNTEHDPWQKNLWKLFAIKVPAEYAAALMVNISRNNIFLYEIRQEFPEQYLRYLLY